MLYAVRLDELMRMYAQKINQKLQRGEQIKMMSDYIPQIPIPINPDNYDSIRKLMNTP